MTKNKRFYVAESNLTDGYCVFDREKKYAFHPKPRKADCLNDAHILNELSDENEQLKQQLQKIQDSFEFSMTKNRVELNKDKLYIKDMNTELRLNGENLFIEVYIPQAQECYRFRYIVAGVDTIREFFENCNSKGDTE